MWNSRAISHWSRGSPVPISPFPRSLMKPRVPGLQNTKNDKKVKNGKINWVLLKEIGKPIIRDDVPDKVVIDSIKESI